MRFKPDEYTGKFKFIIIHITSIELETVFKSLDKNKDDAIDRSEMLNTMHYLGYRSMTEDYVVKLIAEVDLNDNSKDDFDEFLKMMKKFKQSGKETAFTKIVTKTGASLFRFGYEGGASSSSFAD
jgi:hypothetical protein